jgi:hypothetical protein
MIVQGTTRNYSRLLSAKTRPEIATETHTLSCFVSNNCLCIIIYECDLSDLKCHYCFYKLSKGRYFIVVLQIKLN